MSGVLSVDDLPEVTLQSCAKVLSGTSGEPARMVRHVLRYGAA